MKADEIYGTKNPTPHRLLLDTRFELPFGERPPDSSICLSACLPVYLPVCLSVLSFLVFLIFICWHSVTPAVL